jgi:two-component system, cell cycle sensor histidine kinase and response regulator CckA
MADEEVRIKSKPDIAGTLEAENELRILTQKLHWAKKSQSVAIQILTLLNSSLEAGEAIRQILEIVKEFFGFEAVSIRLRDGDDYPYFETQGFPASFTDAENSLCARNEEGEIFRNSAGYPVMECMCGNILQGRTDPALSFFTKGGSFWTNCTTELLDSTTEQERQARTRNRCNGEGYESVALIPLRSAGEIIGLLQLNDSRKNCFTLDMIQYFEGIGAGIGIVLSHKRTELERDRFFNLSIDMLGIAGFDGLYKEVNPAFTKSLGWTKEELLSGPWIEFVHPEDREETFAAEERLKSGEPLYQFRNRCRHRDGTYRWISWDSFSACDEQLIYAVARDVTERKQMEEALWNAKEELQNRSKKAIRESEKRYRSLFENMLDGFAHCKMFFEEGRPQNFIYLDVNDSFYSLTGLNNIVGKKVTEVIPGIKESNPELFEIYGRVASTGNPERFETYVDPMGIWFAVSVYSNEKDHFVSVFENITERKRSEERLHASEEIHRAVFENAGIGIDLLDPQGRILQVNQALSNMLGYSEEEMRQLTFLDITHPEDKEISKGNLEALMAGETECYRFEKRYLRKDGRILWADLTTSAICGPKGEHTGTIGVISDITQRKQAEESLRESENRYRTFFETSVDGVFMTDLDGRFIDANRSLIEMLGYDSIHKEELSKKNVSEFYANHEDREMHAAFVSEKGFSKEYAIDLRKQDGTIIHTLATTATRLDEHGTIVGFQGTVRDISERIGAEKALRASEERFRLIADTAPDIIWRLDKDYRFTYVSPADERIRGFKDHELIGRSIFEVIKPSQVEAAKESALRRLEEEKTGIKTGTLKHQLELVRKDGTYIWTEGYVVPIKDEDGLITGFVGITRDISDRIQAEREKELMNTQLLQAQKMESIGTLTGGIAHDFNNLLTIMNGYTELILSERKENDPIYADLQKILVTGRKGAEMVQRLLTFGKESEITLRPLGLNLVVQNLTSLLDRTFPKMIQIDMILEKEPGTVNGDAVRIEQALMNLCINAKEAMPGGGKITIRTKNVHIDDAYCKLQVTARVGPHVLIEVTDTGVGMGAGTLDRMFEPFFTTKGWDFNKGTGLGLSVAKGIVEQHGGWITCESEPGKGTAFKVYIPVIEQAPVAEKPRPRGEESRSSKKILLVDDEEYVRALGRRVLERAGYDVITASNGGEALNIYLKEQSSIALVVLDLIMPHMGGEKCLQELLKIDPYVKVVVSSGHSLDSRERNHLGAYTKGFVNKPYEMKKLLDVVKKALDSD